MCWSSQAIMWSIVKFMLLKSTIKNNTQKLVIIFQGINILRQDQSDIKWWKINILRPVAPNMV